MMRAGLIFFIGFLAIGQGFGESAIDKLQNKITTAEQWVESETTAAKTNFKGAMKEFSSLHNNVMEKVQRMRNMYDRALDVVESTPPECHQGIKNNLMVLKAGGVGSFFTCSKLLEAGKDIAEIGLTTIDIVGDVIDIGRDVTLGLSGCIRITWPWTVVECLYDRITTTYDDIKRTISDITNYASDISTYARNATELIEYCWHGSSAESDVLAVMKPLHECAKQPVPHHIYKL